MKRLFDIVCSGLALCLFAPLLLILAVKISQSMGRPVLFTQCRNGRDGRPFEMIKFRSMRDATGPDDAPLDDAERLTDFGRKLRASSLDELPGLWNVLKGDMSLVGPRPLLIEYLPLYSPEQARRMVVRPGITGWAQINGRNAISWDERFALDLWYVDNHSLWLDIKIIWMTITKVLKRDGISAKDGTTIIKFTGNVSKDQTHD